MTKKKIEFKIEVSEQLIGRFISNDNQRITQLLVNLLNNSIKFTQEGVKDNGIGIDEHKLNQIQNSLHDTIELGAFLKLDQGIKSPGLGLNIAAKLIEVLVESKDNKLIISSKKNKGTIVQFQVENHQSKNELSSYFPNQQQSEKLSFQVYHNQVQQDQDQIIKVSYENSKEFQDYNNTSRLNDCDKQPEIFLPISPCYFQNKGIHSENNNLNNNHGSNFPTIQGLTCQKCIHVLLVDDIPFNQIALQMILKKYQVETDQAFDGFQAIEMVKQKMQQHCSFYKILFMDIEMPGIDGFQTSKHILELTSNQTYIVICSAYDTQENIFQGKNLGINTFLQKPIKQYELGVVLSMAIREQ